MPEEEIPAGTLTAGPSVANAALFGQDAVEQDESHHATDVSHHDHEHKRTHYERGDEAAHNGRVNVRKAIGDQMARRSTLVRDIEPTGGEIAASAGGHLAGEETDKREARPLPEPERLYELTLRVLERESDGVNGRDGQGGF